MKHRKIAMIFSFSVLAMFCGACAVADAPAGGPPQALSYEDCLTVPQHKLLKTYPAQCVTPDGKVFVDRSDLKSSQRLCSDRCGNGTCEEIVCMGEGCPCPESSLSCPADCKS